MAATVRSNAGSVVFWSLVVCLVVGVVAYLLG